MRTTLTCVRVSVFAVQRLSGWYDVLPSHLDYQSWFTAQFDCLSLKAAELLFNLGPQTLRAKG